MLDYKIRNVYQFFHKIGIFFEKIFAIDKIDINYNIFLNLIEKSKKYRDNIQFAEIIDIDFIRDVFNPDKMNFESINYTEYQDRKYNKSREVWTDSNVLMIYLDSLERIKKLTR